MTVGIFEAPLICSFAGNLRRVAFMLSSLYSQKETVPCYSFHIWYLTGIKDARMEDQTAVRG